MNKSVDRLRVMAASSSIAAVVERWSRPRRAVCSFGASSQRRIREGKIAVTTLLTLE
jgi:hypothetical protein